jgi:hypothetical protein
MKLRSRAAITRDDNMWASQAEVRNGAWMTVIELHVAGDGGDSAKSVAIL